MNTPASEAAKLTLWEYEALLANWNLMHDPDGDVETITAEEYQREIEFFENNPHLLH